jgi:hypothetical protein
MEKWKYKQYNCRRQRRFLIPFFCLGVGASWVYGHSKPSSWYDFIVDGFAFLCLSSTTALLGLGICGLSIRIKTLGWKRTGTGFIPHLRDGKFISISPETRFKIIEKYPERADKLIDQELFYPREWIHITANGTNPEQVIKLCDSGCMCEESSQIVDIAEHIYD